MQCIGHVITVEDGSDYGEISVTGFATDIEAIAWANATFPMGTWHYSAMVLRSSVASHVASHVTPDA